MEIEDDPHVAAAMKQAVNAQTDSADAEDMIGEKMERQSLRAAQQFQQQLQQNEQRHQPPSEGELNQHRPMDSDADDSRTDADKLEDGLDRLFGTDDPEPPQPVAPKKQPEPAAPQAVPEEAFSANIFSWEESQHIAQFEGQRQQFLAAVARHQQEEQLIEQIADPQRKQAAKLWQLQREAALRQYADGLARAGDDIVQTAKSRQENQLQRRRSSELQKLRSAFPDFDAERSRAYLKGYQYDDALINRLDDHRVFVLAEKARLYDEMKRQQKPKVIRKVTQADRSRNDRAKLESAHRSGKYDGIDGALDRRLDEIFR